MKDLCSSLLKTWCDRLLSLQISGTGDPRLDGAVLCPACGRIHGRCFEAMYPFLCMAQQEKDEKWIRAAERLFIWAENTVSLPDGSYVNDIESDWLGTTVFETIQLSDCLLLHKNLLSGETANLWKARIGRAAEFLYGFESLNSNNINYPISNGLAMYECGLVLGEEKYFEKAGELAALAEPVFTESGLLFGEGVPRFQKSGRGCRPVDIGYNVEETLPSLAMYGCLSGDEKALEQAENGLSAHLAFMLENGAWDNSFGTRNFKWTYWGSRTSDGCALGYLLMAHRYPGKHPEFVTAAERNLRLLEQCTHEGLLMGGPHYKQAGQPACVHHTFVHAKVLAGILDRKLWAEEIREEYGEAGAGEIEAGDMENGETKAGKTGAGNKTAASLLPRQRNLGAFHYPEIDTWLVNLRTMTATVTAYDWEYLPGSYASGGTISLLHHNAAGPLLCSGVGEYTLKEPNNMQIPYRVKHECLALRIEALADGTLYSSLYDDSAVIAVTQNSGMEDNGGAPENSYTIGVSGSLKNISHEEAPGKKMSYRFQYRLEENRLTVEAYFEEGVLICPMISRSDESVSASCKENVIEICKDNAVIRAETSSLPKLPYGKERIFNLVPGLQALRMDLKPVNGFVGIAIDVNGTLR